MLWDPVTYLTPRYHRLLAATPTSARERAQDPAVYALTCERALDYLAGGMPQRSHLQAALHRRLGTADADPSKPDGDRSHETDAGRIIREDRTELVTFPLVQSVVDDLAVLYASDDLRRSYQLPDRSEVPGVAELMGDYQSPAMGGLSAKLLQADGLVVLLRTALLLTRWNPCLKQLAYDVIPPHWVHIEPHPQWGLDPRMAFAIAYAESALDTPEASAPRGESVWCAYIRPPFPSEAQDSPARDWPQGRIVRYRQMAPWPPPESGESILEEGPNPFAIMGGWRDGEGQARRVWSPLVWHWAYPPWESLFLPVQDDLVRFTQELDMAWSLVLYLANAQSHGQPVQIGSGTVPHALGASSLVQIDDPQGDFKFVSPGADVQGHLAVIRALIRTHAMVRKLSPDSWSDQRPSIQTGPAKLLEQTGLTEVRQRRILTAETWEARRFDIERVLLNHHVKAQIPWECRQVLSWGELRVPTDRGALVSRLAQERTAGLISQLDAIMEHWGLSREGAMAKLAEIREEQGQEVTDSDDPEDDDGGME